MPAQLGRCGLVELVGAGAVGGADVLGRREPVQGFAEHGALGDGDGEGAVGEAVAVVPQPQGRAFTSAGFLGFEESGFVLVGAFGVDGLQDPAAQGGQGVGVEVAGGGEEVLLGEALVVGVLRSEVVDGGVDDEGLLGVDLAAGHRVPGLLVTGQRCRQAHLSGGCGTGSPGESGEPGGGGAKPARGGHLKCLGVLQHPCLELVDPCVVGGQAGDHLGGLGGVERPGRGLDQGVELALEGVEAPQDRVC